MSEVDGRSMNSDILLPCISNAFRVRVLSRLLSRALILSELVVRQISLFLH